MSLSNRFRSGHGERATKAPTAPAAQEFRLSGDRPAGAWKPQRKKTDRSDIVVGALGVALALTCALFPWYIFFNQEKFGVREFVFQSNDSAQTPTAIAYQPQLVGKPFSTGEVPKMNLDLFPTATLRPANEPARAVPVSDQPFPADEIDFRLVHVANGRAMIEDEDGLWVVQPGSRLPDASRVSVIEKRDGGWVLVTSRDEVIQLVP